MGEDGERRTKSPLDKNPSDINPRTKAPLDKTPPSFGRTKPSIEVLTTSSVFSQRLPYCSCGYLILLWYHMITWVHYAFSYTGTIAWKTQTHCYNQLMFSACHKSHTLLGLWDRYVAASMWSWAITMFRYVHTYIIFTLTQSYLHMQSLYQSYSSCMS